MVAKPPSLFYFKLYKFIYFRFLKSNSLSLELPSLHTWRNLDLFDKQADPARSKHEAKP